MKRYLLFFVVILIFPLIANAQKGTNLLQVAGHAAIPTGGLNDVVSTGFGGSLKGMLGISRTPQYITLEAGYDIFNVKNLPSNASAHFSAIPIYAGYRASLGGIIIESQMGVSFNRIAGVGPGGTASANRTAYAWAVGAGYTFNKLELDVRYQSSEGGDDTYIIRFVGLRVGYNFAL